MKRATLLTLLTVFATSPAFAEDSTSPILDVFARIIVMGANLWGVLTWVVPVVMLAVATSTALFFMRREQIGTTVVASLIGVFLAIIVGFSMYKAGPAIKKFAENAGVMSTEVIDVDSGE